MDQELLDDRLQMAGIEDQHVVKHPTTGADEALRDRVRRARPIGQPQELLESPQAFVGTIDDMADNLGPPSRAIGHQLGDVGEPDDRVTPLVERIAGT